VVDPVEVPSVDPNSSWARALRLELAHEHLGVVDDTDLENSSSSFARFAQSAAQLDAWHRAGRVGPRPPGRLRAYRQPQLSPVTRAWATPLYRLLYDPDGRTRSMRRANRY